MTTALRGFMAGLVISALVSGLLYWMVTRNA